MLREKEERVEEGKQKKNKGKDDQGKKQKERIQSMIEKVSKREREAE